VALWGKNDAASNAVKYQVVTGDTANGQVAYANNTVSEFTTNQRVGIFGVDTTEATVKDGVLAHPGWVLVRKGTGAVSSLAVNAIGTGYTNGNVVTVSGGTTNATFTVVTGVANTSVASLTTVSLGNGFSNGSTTVAVANSTGGATGVGTGATFVLTLGGRANRVHYETLVAMGTITGDGADDATFADS
jgi:hypothetical protein